MPSALGGDAKPLPPRRTYFPPFFCECHPKKRKQKYVKGIKKKIFFFCRVRAPFFSQYPPKKKYGFGICHPAVGNIFAAAVVSKNKLRFSSPQKGGQSCSLNIWGEKKCLLGEGKKKGKEGPCGTINVPFRPPLQTDRRQSAALANDQSLRSRIISGFSLLPKFSPDDVRTHKETRKKLRETATLQYPRSQVLLFDPVRMLRGGKLRAVQLRIPNNTGFCRGNIEGVRFPLGCGAVCVAAALVF